MWEVCISDSYGSIWIYDQLWIPFKFNLFFPTLVEQNPQSSRVFVKRIGCLDFPVGKSAGEPARYKQLLRRAWKGSYEGWVGLWGFPDQVGPLIPAFTSHGWCTSCNNSRQDVSFYCRSVAVVNWVCVFLRSLCVKCWAVRQGFYIHYSNIF